MAVLPTSFGKSLIYQIIPKVLEYLKNESDDTQKVIVYVVSSLEYIRKQQVYLFLLYALYELQNFANEKENYNFVHEKTVTNSQNMHSVSFQ